MFGSLEGKNVNLRVVEKAGFKRKGTLRRLIFMRGDWRDAYVYSILREEWKKPRILTRTA